MMHVVKCDQTTFFDVDDTLVLWNIPANRAADVIFIPCGDEFVQVVPHRKHIEQLKRHKARGHTVIVWSAGGSEWAKNVVEMLQLTSLVDVVMAKPTWFYDDLTVEEFMPKINQVYYKDE